MSVEAFVMAATSGHRDRAGALLASEPEIERDRWARLVLGREWTGDPNEVGGPRQWAPLHYVCHSCFSDRGLARELLERGANPNAYFANEHGPMSTLFGAAGVLHDPELTELLLEHGADPDGEPWFGDALYHSVEARDPACTRVLLEHGATARGSHALAHALDYERPEHVRMLLDAEEEPRTLLVHSIRRGGDLATVQLLLDAGADLEHRGGEWSTPPEQYRTAYQNAFIRRRADVVALLEERGASTELKPGDRAVAALGAGEPPLEPLPESLDADSQEVVILGALAGRFELVVEHLGPDYFGHVGGGPPGTLLHHASWVGNPVIVRRLLELGADPVAPSGAQFDMPIAWAALGSSAHWAPGRDYVAVVEALLAAGAELEDRFADVAEGPLAGWLAERS